MTGAGPRPLHWGDRAAGSVELAARDGAWTAGEAVAALRQWLVRAGGDVDPLGDEVVSWVTRDLAPPAGEAPDPDRMYREVAAGRAGEVPFLAGRSALEAQGYGEFADWVEPWTADRYLGLACPWIWGLPDAGARVLDLGSGSGTDRSIAARAVGRSGLAIGIDSRPTLLAPSAVEAPVVAVATALQSPIASGSIDVVVANGLPPLLRTGTAIEVIGEVRRMLRPGGHLRFTTLVSGGVVDAADLDDAAVLDAVRIGKPVWSWYAEALARLGFRSVRAEPARGTFAPGWRSGPVVPISVAAIGD